MPHIISGLSVADYVTVTLSVSELKLHGLKQCVVFSDTKANINRSFKSNHLLAT